MVFPEVATASEIGERISTKTNVQTLADGTLHQQVEVVRSYWSNVPSTFRYALYGYIFMTACCYILYNYHDGRNALVQHRATSPSANPVEEWQAIRKGIRSWENFVSSMWFPYSLSEKVMPAIVLWLNPRK
jgi:hypothetical protein